MTSRRRPASEPPPDHVPVIGWWRGDSYPLVVWRGNGRWYDEFGGVKDLGRSPDEWEYLPGQDPDYDLPVSRQDVQERLIDAQSWAAISDHSLSSFNRAREQELKWVLNLDRTNPPVPLRRGHSVASPGAEGQPGEGGSKAPQSAISLDSPPTTGTNENGRSGASDT